MILNGRSISSGKAEGIVLKLNDAFSFLGGVDGSTGELRTEGGGNLAGKVFVFPKGKGSTVGSFTMYDLMVHGKNPAAVVNQNAETIVATGAVISSIPMIDRVDVDLIQNGDRMIVDGTAGTAELPDVKMIETSSSAIVVKGKVLMLKRPMSARSFPGRWSLVAGKLEKGEDAEKAAIREIREETGIKVNRPAARLEPIFVRENDIIWKVNPFLFLLDSASPVLNRENEAFRWVSPDEIHSPETVSSTREAVKKLLCLTKS